MQLSFENLLVEIQQQGNDVKVLIDSNSTLLMNQDVQQVAEQLRSNFDIVFSNYLNLANASKEEMNKEDLVLISLSITAHYLYMYNMWRHMYKYEHNRTLKFDKKDFNTPDTHDLIFYYYKMKYPSDWQRKAAVLVNMTNEEVQAYYKRREQFYDK